MTDAFRLRPGLSADVCVRALQARDARFDGVFFVGITSTSIYCRPICPARVSRPDHRRFFGSAAAAERDGFRPCRRCRPELAPGRALVDAVSRLASAAARRIAAGALNGRHVRDLAAELCVSERHLRRALEREIGVSPVELAQTHRLLLAKQLLTDTALPMTSIAYTSGFQSLRRFNALFRERYGMSPGSLRPVPRHGSAARRRAHPKAPADLPADLPAGLVRLTLAYREPFAWDALQGWLRRDALPGVEVMAGSRYSRTVQLGEHTGAIVLDVGGPGSRARRSVGTGLVAAHVSPALLPVLMPLLARVRQLFDLDAEPSVVDDCLARAGLAAFVRRRPGIRVPGAFDGFEVGLRTLLRGRSRPGARQQELAGRVAAAIGAPVQTGIDGLDRLAPTADRVAEAGAARLVRLGVPAQGARTIEAFARAVADGRLSLDPGSDVDATCAALTALPGIGDRIASMIALRALCWPDTFPAADRALQRAAGAASARALSERARAWQPWRAYAAMHLWQHEHRGRPREDFR